MTEKATTKTTRRNVGEIIQRERVYYIRYYDLRGRRRLESTHSDDRNEAEKLLRKRLSAKDGGVLPEAAIGSLTLKEATDDLIADYETNKRKSLRDVQGKITMHLLPFFGERRKMISIGTPEIALPDERQTVAQFLDAWLEHKRTRLRSRAWLTYEQAVRLHLSPGIGKVPVARLTVGQLEAWFSRHQEAGTSARTIRYARAVLRIALNRARKAGLVVQNVAALAEPPKHRAREIQPLTPEQARTLLTAVKGHRLGALVSVATALGLRLGEALGLRWEDVNFDAGTLSVRQTIERSGGDVTARRQLGAAKRELRKRIAEAGARSIERRELWKELEALRKKWREVRTTLKTAEPKSARSKRTVRMPGVVVTALKAHRTRQLKERLAAGGAWEDSGLIFTTPFGTAVDPRGASREFHAMLEKAKLPSVRFHDLRHTAATLLLAQGVDARTIMRRWGTRRSA